MAKAEFQGRTTGVLSPESRQSEADTRFHDNLQGLFAEVTALANQLRRTAVSAPRQSDSLVGGRSILQVLGRQGPLTVPAIARIRTVSRQSIQTLVNRLGAHGYVALSANPAHTKSGLVQLTDQGRKLLAAVTERESKSSKALLPYVSETRLVLAARLLRQLRELLAGNGAPPAEAARGRPTRKRAQARPKPARRSEGGLAPADLPPLPEPTEPDETEFPVSLL